MDLSQQITQELESLDKDALKRMLIEHLQKQNARKKSYNTPESKERRKAYYEAKKDTPEWKEARTRQAAIRKARLDALLALAKSKFSAAELAEVGL